MLRVLELFAGIGGLRCAFPECEVVAAIDISENAAKVYQANFDAHYWIREIESLSGSELEVLNADLWWMSPPCQPYSVRGNRKALRDSRAASFLHVLRLAEEVRPPRLIIENVPGFAHSDALSVLVGCLQRMGYHWQMRELCPTQMGWPNLRNRFYLVASHGKLMEWQGLPHYELSLNEVLGSLAVRGAKEEEEDSLFIDPRQLERFESAMDIVNLDSQRAACFGSSYGKSLLRAGSYVQVNDRIRRFTPREVTSLLGFPAYFKVDEVVSRRTAWKLLGNSLSLPAVRYIVSHLEHGISATLPWIER